MDKSFMKAQKKSTADTLKTVSKRVTQKTADETGVLVGNNVSERITKGTSKSASEASSKWTAPAQTHETSIQPLVIPKEKYISPYKRQQSVNN